MKRRSAVSAVLACVLFLLAIGVADACHRRCRVARYSAAAYSPGRAAETYWQLCYYEANGQYSGT